ncbi:MAG: hypothetical protein APF81_14835 [Desulfosporosinus sp. BRH_c37]|nr:MAG: hypothetical protein APF81_14835 [Desulfosporosinus sp. BRH_c37]
MKSMNIGKTVFIMILILALGLAGCSSKPTVSEQFDYEGELKGNLAHGLGTLYEEGVLFYEGEFNNGLINGQGKIYQDGLLKYEGQFKDAQALGQGTLYSKAGKKLFEGTITENDGQTYKGTGTLYNDQEEPVYLGEITVKGSRVGLVDRGKILYPSGEVFYEGELKDGMPAGKGTYYDLEGTVLKED